MEITERLERAGIRPSAVRILILRELTKIERPISALELEDRLESVDRSTITRTLSLFLKNGLLHPINDGTGSVRYEMCRHIHDTREGCDTDMHDDFHVHFHCRVCGVTECMPGTLTPHVELPEGYRGELLNYVIVGVCAGCAHKV